MALDAPQAVRRLDNGSSSVARRQRRSIPEVAWPGHESVDSFGHGRRLANHPVSERDSHHRQSGTRNAGYRAPGPAERQPMDNVAVIPSRAGMDLIGRAAEFSILDAFLDRAFGDGAAQLLTGGPGVGRTVLLDAACRL